MEPDHACVETWFKTNSIVFLALNVFNFSIDCVGILTIVAPLHLIRVFTAQEHLSWTRRPEHMTWFVWIVFYLVMNFVKISDIALLNFLKSLGIATEVALIA